MVASPNAAQVTRHIGAMTLTLKSDLEIELSRVFNAPKRLVFEAHARPEHVRQWWGRGGTTMTSCEMDFRPGGKWRYVIQKASGHAYAFRGEYREIVAPDRFVQTFEFEGMPGSVGLETYTFTEHDGQTTLRTISHFDSIATRDAVIQSGMEKGAAEMWDRLENLLSTLQ